MPATTTCAGKTTDPQGRTRNCPHLIPRGTRYCPTHARQYEQRRGSSTARGYDHAHRTRAEAYRAQVRAGHPIRCWRCGQLITNPDDLDLGHDDNDRSVTRGPEHARACNRAEAGRRAHPKPQPEPQDQPPRK